jgi:GcrA cell cycle regulator
MPHPSIDWNDANVELLKRLWADGLTASQVGAKMGISRNAVLAKVHRLNLSGRAKPPPRNRNTTKKPRQRVRHVVHTKAMQAGPNVLAFVEPLNGKGVSLIERKPLQCAWVISEKGDDGLAIYCGHQIADTRWSWCPFHCSMGLTKPVRPERRDEPRKSPSKFAGYV